MIPEEQKYQSQHESQVNFRDEIRDEIMVGGVSIGRGSGMLLVDDYGS